MRNYVKTGAIVSVTATAALASGAPVLVGNLFGVAQRAAASGEKAEILTEGEFLLPKEAAADFTEGEPVYFDAAAGKCGEKAAGRHLIGVATVAAGNGATVAQVRLNGTSTVVAS